MRSFFAAVFVFAAAGLFASQTNVFTRGERIRLETGLEGKSEGFRAWSLAAYVCNVPAAFKDKNASRTRKNASEPQFSSFDVIPYKWTSRPPATIELDTGDWPAGDYRLTMHTLVSREGKDSYLQTPLTFSLREKTVSSPVGDSGEIAYVEGFCGNPKGVHAVDVPWHGDFSLIKSHARPAARTKFKVFHDNDWLYFAVVAEEPLGVGELRKMPKAGYESYLVSDHRRDALEISVDPTGKGNSFYKIIVNPTGDMSDLRGEDDNTNTGKYVFDERWRSHARTAVTFGEKTWMLELAVPIGAFDGVPVDAGAKWGIAVGRQRYAGTPGTPSYLQEFSISFPSVNLGEAPAFPKFALARFRPGSHAWDVPSLKTAIAPVKGGLGVTVRATLFNRTGDFRDARLKVVAEDKQGREIVSGLKPLPITSGFIRETAVSLSPVPAGETTLRLEITGADGILEKGMWQYVNVEYEPVKIKLTKPAYRDCVFDSMNLKALEGVVELEEGLGKGLDLFLTGPDTDERIRFENAKAVNKFVFPFENKPKGDYFLKAGGVTKRVRNLPFKAGEVWLDATGVAYREGKKMLPFGFFSEQYRSMFPGLNIAQSYAPRIKVPSWVAWRCEEAHSNGCGFVFSPYQDFADEPWEKIFGRLARQGEFGKGKLGEQQKKALRRFAELVREQRGFFAYYMDDEPEGRGVNPDFHADARKFLMEIDPYHPAIMLNYSVEGVRRYHEGGDILSPDAYAVYYEDGGTMSPKRGSYDKPKAASELAAAWLTPAAFDWARPDGDRRPRGPKYSELREQCLMGLAADARGFMFYDRHDGQPGGYHILLGTKFVLEELTEARDAFLSPSLPLKQKVTPEKTAVFSAMKRFGDDCVVIVVNSERVRCRVVLRRDDLPKKLYLGGVKDPIEVTSGEMVLDLEPYESRVYRSKPWKFSPAKAQAEIEAAEAGRRKPGNLCVAEHFRTWKEVSQRGEGAIDRAGPHFTVSSSHRLSANVYNPYFLQDGIATDFPPAFYQGWSPRKDDPKPWVKCDFRGKKRFSKVVLTRVRDAGGRYLLKAGAIEANGREIARFDNLEGATVKVEFAPVEADSFTVRIFERDFDAYSPILSEVEAYE